MCHQTVRTARMPMTNKGLGHGRVSPGGPRRSPAGLCLKTRSPAKRKPKLSHVTCDISPRATVGQPAPNAQLSSPRQPNSNLS